jgi:hypothetical protein
MVQPEIGFGIKADQCDNKHEEQHLKRLSCADEAPEKILTQLQCGQYHHHQDRDQYQVVVIIDLEHRRKLIA